jgi:GNAT superfamily N-acetyltransferase
MTSSTTTADDLPMPNRPDLPGLRFRHWQGFDDLIGMAAANQRARDAFGQEDVINVESMTRTYRNLPHCDLSKDLIVVERAGRTIGYVRVEWQDLTNGGRQFFSFCTLDPVERGQGIGQAMLSWSESRLAEIAAEVPNDRAGQLFAFTFEADAPGRTLLERNGWHAVARGHEMVRPTLDDISESPLPEGLVVRAVDESARRVVWEAARDAFRDERDAQEWTEGQWATFMGDVPDVSLWIIAFDGESVAGGIWNIIDADANAHHGRARGLLAAVWTGAAWRRRGLAKALIARSLVTLRDRGMTSAYLGVDGANPNQAMDLYTSQGFESANSTIDWRKPLPSAMAESPPEVP